MKLSDTAYAALAALGSDDNLVIATLRNTGPIWRAEVCRRNGQVSRFTVPVPVFRKLVALGLVEKTFETEVSGTLVRADYALTDAGRAQLRA